MYFALTLLVVHISALTENYTYTIQHNISENDTFQEIETNEYLLFENPKYLETTETFQSQVTESNNEWTKFLNGEKTTETEVTQNLQSSDTENPELYTVSTQLTSTKNTATFQLTETLLEIELNDVFANLTKRLANLNTLVISYEIDVETIILNHLTTKTIVSPFKPTNFDENTKFDLFIIIIKSLDHTSNFLQKLVTDFGYQVRAKFIFINLNTTLETQDIFKLTWNVYIMNIIVLQKQNIIWRTFTHFPYANRTCGLSLEPVEHLDLFPSKIDLNMQGCDIRLMGLHLKPYVLDVTKSLADPTIAGVEVTIIHNILKKMNFTEQYIPNPYPHWGYYYKNGEFTMIFKEIHNKKADIGFGMMIGNDTIEKYFDGTVQHIDTTAVWFVPTALPIAQWKNLTVIFDGIVWSSIFFVFMLNGVIWYVLGRNREQSASYNELSLCLMGAFYILLQGSFTTPEAWKIRFVVVIWSVSSLLIFTAHQCQLTGILTSPLYEHQISNLKELVESNLEYGFYPILKDLYSDPTNKIRWTVLKKFKPCSLTQTCMNRTAFNRDFAVIKNRRQGAYFMPKYYTSTTGKPMLYVFKASEFVVWCKYFVPKGFPFLDRINQLILLLQSNGLIAKWDADIVAGPTGDDDRTELEPLTLNHLQGAFFLLIFGSVISLCMFGSEKVYFRVWGKKNVDKTLHDLAIEETFDEETLKEIT